MSKKKDLLGLVFDRLTVIGNAENTKTGQAVWICSCSCGKQTKVVGSKLLAGKTKSCGCLKQEGKKATDLTGQVFGELVVLSRNGSSKFKRAMWLCQCSCGNRHTVIAESLIMGHTKSCGCVKKAGQYNVIHGHKRLDGGTKAYKVWSNMKSRCTNPKASQYKDYGGRGITVCERWLESFENFLEDMGEPPSGTLQLDRRDNDKGYSKENCRWVTRSVNRRNSRGHMVYVTIYGETMILTDAIKKYKVVSYTTATSRINRGWPPEEAVMTPYTRCDNKGYREKQQKDTSA
jgi:hypothetical protein